MTSDFPQNPIRILFNSLEVGMLRSPHSAGRLAAAKRGTPRESPLHPAQHAADENGRDDRSPPAPRNPPHHPKRQAHRKTTRHSQPPRYPRGDLKVINEYFFQGLYALT